MQHALVRFNDGTYTEFLVRDQHLHAYLRYAVTENLLNNTEYPSELIWMLNNTYAHWVLILSGTDALLITYNANGDTLAHGKTDNIVDWVRDVTTRAPSNPVEPANSEILTGVFDALSISTLLHYLYAFNCVPQLSSYEELHPVQTDNGTVYWCCFLPTAGFSS